MKHRPPHKTLAFIGVVCIFFIVPLSAEAAISVPQNVGHQSCTGCANSSGSFSSLPAAGSTIVVTISYLDFGNTGPSRIQPTDVTDNQGHSSYTLATTSQLGTSDSLAYIYYISNISSPSGTYTITINNSAAGNGFFEWTASEVDGLIASPLDQAFAAKGASASLTAGSAGPTNALTLGNEVSFAVISIQNTSANNAITTPAGYTQLYVSNDTDSNQSGEAGYKVLSSFAAQTASWTWGTAGDFSAMIATFMGAAPRLAINAKTILNVAMMIN
jgi:hypothetical protein